MYEDDGKTRTSIENGQFELLNFNALQDNNQLTITLNRKGDGEPGPKTLWIGLQRVRDFMLGINAQKESQKIKTCV